MIEAGGLVEMFYRGVTDTHHLALALETMGSRFGCRSASLVSLDAGQPGAAFALATGVFDEAAARRYHADFAVLDPAPRAFALMSPGSASTTDRILSEDDLRHGAFVNEFYRPLGLSETIGGLLRIGDGRFEMLGLQRGPDRGAFTADELAAVERFLPHLARSLQLRRTFLAQDLRIASLEAGLDRMAPGIVLLDGAGGAVFVNAAMRAIARRDDGLGLHRSGRPVASDPASRRRLGLLLAAVARGHAGGIVAVPSRRGARPYVVLVAPAPPAMLEHLFGKRGSGAIAIVHDPADRAVDGAALLREAFGLTRGAAALAVALAGDDDLKSFAERQGITIHTARFHLRTALARTGTRTQAELVRLIVGLLRDLRLGAPPPDA
jgi:DNA-binding CsgD family transcriptional regulator